MLEVLQFLFQDFWHWFGGSVYLAMMIGTISSFNLIKISKIEKDKE